MKYYHAINYIKIQVVLIFFRKKKFCSLRLSTSKVTVAPKRPLNGKTLAKEWSDFFERKHKIFFLPS
jgi:hypothetical protein